MSPLRNSDGTTSRSRRIARVGQALGTAALVGGFVGLTACSDVPSAPSAPAAAAPSLNLLAPVLTGSHVVSQTTVGDTIVTRFVVGNTSTESRQFGLGNGHKIHFPRSASSICTLATSGYGPGTWDAACLPSAVPVQITAKVWFDAAGLPRTDFQPAMRFVPGADGVVLALRAKNGTPSSAARVVYCTNAGSCIDEAATDKSLVTQIDPSNGFWVRRIKHFSGYNVTFGFTRQSGEDTGFDSGSGW